MRIVIDVSVNATGATSGGQANEAVPRERALTSGGMDAQSHQPEVVWRSLGGCSSKVDPMSNAEVFWLHALGLALFACASVALLEAAWQAWRHRRRRVGREHGRMWLTTTSLWPDED
jgi:hypothetical protein